MKNKKGFTLIELLVVIAIIGLLSTLAVVSLNGARAKARDAKRVSDVKQISTLIEMEAANSSTGGYDVLPTECDAAGELLSACDIGGVDLSTILIQVAQQLVIQLQLLLVLIQWEWLKLLMIMKSAFI